VNGRRDGRPLSTPDDLLRRVALDFKLPASAIAGRAHSYDVARARHAYWYLLVQLLPRPSYYICGENRAGRRAPIDRDGMISAAARLVGYDRRAISYGMRRTEDRRDDPAFDDLLSAIELDLAKDTSDKPGN